MSQRKSQRRAARRGRLPGQQRKHGGSSGGPSVGGIVALFVVRPEGIEPPTLGLEVSIPASHAPPHAKNTRQTITGAPARFGLFRCVFPERFPERPARSGRAVGYPCSDLSRLRLRRSLHRSIALLYTVCCDKNPDRRGPGTSDVFRAAGPHHSARCQCVRPPRYADHQVRAHMTAPGMGALGRVRARKAG